MLEDSKNKKKSEIEKVHDKNQSFPTKGAWSYSLHWHLCTCHIFHTAPLAHYHLRQWNRTRIVSSRKYHTFVNLLHNETVFYCWIIFNITPLRCNYLSITFFRKLFVNKLEVEELFGHENASARNNNTKRRFWSNRRQGRFCCSSRFVSYREWINNPTVHTK